MQRRFAPVLILVLTTSLALVFSGCRKKGTVVASCDRRSKDKDVSECIDAFDKKATAMTVCQDDRGETLIAGTPSDKPCDRTGALAGCKESEGITWYFPSKRVSKVEHVASRCNVILLDVGGNELKGVKPVEAPTKAEAEAAAELPTLKPKIESKLAMVEQIGKKLPSPSAKIIAAPTAIAEALVAHAEDLKAIGEQPSVGHRSGASDRLAQCTRMIRKNDNKGVADSATVLRRCANATHLVVIRTASLTEPKPVGGVNSYEAGRASGDILVFELAQGKLVGTAPFTAKSNRDLSTTWKNFEADLREDFDKQLRSEWRSAGAKAVPVGNGVAL